MAGRGIMLVLGGWSSAAQGALFFSVPIPDRHLSAGFALFAIFSYPLIPSLDTSLLLRRLRRLHWMVRASVLLRERWKLVIMWQRQRFTRLLPARSLPRTVGLCISKLAILSWGVW